MNRIIGLLGMLGFAAIFCGLLMKLLNKRIGKEREPSYQEAFEYE